MVQERFIYLAWVHTYPKIKLVITQTHVTVLGDGTWKSGLWRRRREILPGGGGERKMPASASGHPCGIKNLKIHLGEIWNQNMVGYTLPSHCNWNIWWKIIIQGGLWRRRCLRPEAGDFAWRRRRKKVRRRRRHELWPPPQPCWKVHIKGNTIACHTGLFLEQGLRCKKRENSTCSPIY